MFHDSSLQNSKAFSGPLVRKRPPTADTNSTFRSLNGDAAVSPLPGNSSQHSAGLALIPGSDLTTLEMPMPA